MVGARILMVKQVDTQDVPVFNEMISSSLLKEACPYIVNDRFSQG
jgi:hypothetical protein